MNYDRSFETHNVIINNRRNTELTGIDDVISFDDNSISVHSALGDLILEGEELKIDSFSGEKGILQISGKIIGIFYTETSKKRHIKKKKIGQTD